MIPRKDVRIGENMKNKILAIIYLTLSSGSFMLLGSSIGIDYYNGCSSCLFLTPERFFYLSAGIVLSIVFAHFFGEFMKEEKHETAM